MLSGWDVLFCICGKILAREVSVVTADVLKLGTL